MDSYTKILNEMTNDSSSLIYKDKIIEAKDNYSFPTQYLENRWNVNDQKAVKFLIENKKDGDYFTFDDISKITQSEMIKNDNGITKECIYLISYWSFYNMQMAWLSKRKILANLDHQKCIKSTRSLLSEINKVNIENKLMDFLNSKNRLPQLGFVNTTKLLVFAYPEEFAIFDRMTGRIFNWIVQNSDGIFENCQFISGNDLNNIKSYPKYLEVLETLLKILNLPNWNLRDIEKALFTIGRNNRKLSSLPAKINSTGGYLPNGANPLNLFYRDKNLDYYTLAASKVANPSIKLMRSILSDFLNIFKEKIKKTNENYLTYNECKGICNNYRDYQNLLYQLGLLDKQGNGKYFLTDHGLKIAEGENFCDHIFNAIHDVIINKKESDHHIILLIWLYHQIRKITNKNPKEEHFQKNSVENSAYPNIRLTAAKNIYSILFKCNEEKANDFFDIWEETIS